MTHVILAALLEIILVGTQPIIALALISPIVATPPALLGTTILLRRR